MPNFDKVTFGPNVFKISIASLLRNFAFWLPAVFIGPPAIGKTPITLP